MTRLDISVAVRRPTEAARLEQHVHVPRVGYPLSCDRSSASSEMAFHRLLGLLGLGPNGVQAHARDERHAALDVDEVFWGRFQPLEVCDAMRRASHDGRDFLSESNHSTRTGSDPISGHKFTGVRDYSVRQTKGLADVTL
jgi:hypothetical protein